MKRSIYSLKPSIVKRLSEAYHVAVGAKMAADAAANVLATQSHAWEMEINSVKAHLDLPPDTQVSVNFQTGMLTVTETPKVSPA